MADRKPRKHLPLAPLAYQILLALVDGDQHGYGLLAAIQQRTGRRISPSTGTVYLALQRLEDSGLVRESPVRPAEDDDSRRRYYRITQLGRRVAAAEGQRYLDLARQAADARLIPVSRIGRPEQA